MATVTPTQAPRDPFRDDPTGGRSRRPRQVAETFTPELPQQDRTAGSAYGKFKTTVYLPKNLKRALEIEAAARRVSDADLIRHAVSAEVGVMDGRLPPSDVFSGGADLARHVDEHLDGFGQW